MRGAPKGGVVYCNVDLGGLVLASLGALAAALYARIDDVVLWPEDLHGRCHGRPPKIGEAERAALDGRRGQRR